MTSILSLHSIHLDNIICHQDKQSSINLGKTCRHFFTYIKEILKYQAIEAFIRENYIIHSDYSRFVCMWQALREVTLNIAETHTNNTHRQNLAKIVNAMWHRSSALFTENALTPMEGQLAYILPQIGKQAKSWDCKEDEFKYARLFILNLKILILLTQHFIALKNQHDINKFVNAANALLLFLNSNANSSENNEAIEKLKLIQTELEIMSNINFNEKTLLSASLITLSASFILYVNFITQRKTCVLNLIKDCISHLLVKHYSSFADSVDQHLQKRNKHLVKSIYKKVYEGKSPIVLAGTEHVIENKIIENLKYLRIDFISIIPKRKSNVKDFSDLTLNSEQKLKKIKEFEKIIIKINDSNVDSSNFYKSAYILSDYFHLLS